jgi:hypothetical protein
MLQRIAERAASRHVDARSEPGGVTLRAMTSRPHGHGIPGQDGGRVSGMAPAPGSGHGFSQRLPYNDAAGARRSMSTPDTPEIAPGFGSMPCPPATSRGVPPALRADTGHAPRESAGRGTMAPPLPKSGTSERAGPLLTMSETLNRLRSKGVRQNEAPAPSAAMGPPDETVPGPSHHGLTPMSGPDATAPQNAGRKPTHRAIPIAPADDGMPGRVSLRAIKPGRAEALLGLSTAARQTWAASETDEHDISGAKTGRDSDPQDGPGDTGLANDGGVSRGRVSETEAGADSSVDTAAPHLSAVSEPTHRADPVPGAGDDIGADLAREIAAVERRLQGRTTQPSRGVPASGEAPVPAGAAAETSDPDPGGAGIAAESRGDTAGDLPETPGAHDARGSSQHVEASDSETSQAGAKTHDRAAQAASASTGGAAEEGARRSGETEEARLSRLVESTDTRLSQPEERRRLSAIAHLRAAVVATRAEGVRNTAPQGAAADLASYRADLAAAIRSTPPRIDERLELRDGDDSPAEARPRKGATLDADGGSDQAGRAGDLPTDASPAAPGSRSGRETPVSKFGPLLLVSGDRIREGHVGNDAKAPVGTHPPEDLQEGDTPPEKAAASVLEGATAMADAEAAGALPRVMETQDPPSGSAPDADGAGRELQRLLAESGDCGTEAVMIAAARALTAAERRGAFTHPDLWRLIRAVAPGLSDLSREESLRAFGSLLKSGVVRKVRRGRFELSDPASFGIPGLQSRSGSNDDGRYKIEG